MVQNIRGEAPHIHGDEAVHIYRGKTTLSVGNACALCGLADIVGLDDMGQMTVFVGLADAAGDGTVFT